MDGWMEEEKRWIENKNCFLFKCKCKLTVDAFLEKEKRKKIKRKERNKAAQTIFFSFLSFAFFYCLKKFRNKKIDGFLSFFFFFQVFVGLVF